MSTTPRRLDDAVEDEMQAEAVLLPPLFNIYLVVILFIILDLLWPSLCVNLG
jgi:hypothetical protein